MAVDFHAWAAQVKRLAHALADLEPAAARLAVELAAGEEWHELLAHKLLPQVEARPVLVVAIVGGTNIGKSAIFNQLAGEVASATSPLAAGTRHPVCLVPSDFDDEAALARIFTGFDLRRWHSPDDPLTDSAEHRLFWRAGANVPPRLLLLDTPDIDSDAQVNWQRADTIRQAADVLVAVLTQQKYNDAAVKQFFRKAADADKPIIVLFNQCDLDADREFWPLWLATFADETGARPDLVYVIPFDRRGANELGLSFHAVGPTGRQPPAETSSLRDELAALHFERIKIRTFRGALERVLDPRVGAPAWLARIRARAGEFAAAAQSLSAAEMARVHWPVVPPQVLVGEIRDWWDARRSPWSRGIHGVYRAIGTGASRPIRAAWHAISGPPVDPLATFRAREREAIVEAVEKLLDELDRLRRVGNETLRPRLESLLSGASRTALLSRVLAAHERLPALDDDYRATLRAELERWGTENPRAISFLRSLDHAAAVARPAITVVLLVTGTFVGTEVVGQTAVHLAGHTAGNLAAEAAIAGGITVGGEAVVTATGEGVKQAGVRLFRRLQTRYAESRASWLAGWLDRELLGGLLTELRAGAEVPRSPAFTEMAAAVAALRATQV
ncbi:MAG: GTPase domain-containing protein [Planctomycetia bacterium]|nr:GTPase domain-containing protein [Planctomycetia bacterium]